MSLHHRQDETGLSIPTALEGKILEGQTHILQLLLQNTPTNHLLQTIAAWLETNCPTPVQAAICLTDTFGRHLAEVVTAAPATELQEALRCRDLSNLDTQARETAVPPATLYSHPWWLPAAKVLDQAGIVAATSFPLINADKHTAAVLEVLQATPAPLTPYDRQVIALAVNMILLTLAQAQQLSINHQLIEREKMAREEVNKADLLAQFAVEGAGAGTFNVNLTDNYIKYSPLLSKILTGEYLTGMTRKQLVDNIHPEDVPIRDAAYQLAATTGHLEYEARFIWRDGSIHWVKALGTYLTDSTGSKANFAGMVLDITPEVKAREQQQRLLALIENSADYMAVADTTNTLVYLNKAGRQLMGIEPDREAATIKSHDFTTAEEFERVRRQVHPAVAQYGTWSGIIDMQHFITGEIIPCHAEYTSITDPSTGEYLGRGVTMRDLRPELASRKALQESEQRFRRMIEHAPIAMGVFKGDDLIVEVANAKLLNLWDKKASVIGLPFVEALPEIRDQAFPALMREVMRTGKAHYGSETLARLNRNGRIEDGYFNFVYAPFREGDHITGVQVVASEVTAQVHTKKALEASEARFRNFIHSAPVPIALYTGREMRIQIANEAVLHTWNRDASVIGKTFREALPELKDTPWPGKLEQVYDTGNAFYAYEERVDLLNEGQLETFYFNFTYKPLYDGEDKIYGVINTAADVTKLVLARQELLQTQAQLTSAIESAQMATWRIDLQQQFAYFSSRLRHWFGFETEQINLPAGFEAIHPADRQRVLQHLQQAIEGDAAGYTDEYRVINQLNDTEYYIRVTSKIHRNEKGIAYELIGVAQDITDQKQMEFKLEQLVQQRTEELSRANQHLQQSNEELEQFAYVASHDLQEPLRKIRIFSGMLMNHLQLQHGQEQHTQLLEKVISSAGRMSQLIMDLLNYSHISKKEALFQQVDLNTVIQNVHEDFELLIRQKQAILHIERLPVIEAIPLQMNQLLYNLMGNALKFTHPDRIPTLRIQAWPATPELIAATPGLTGSNYWVITIADNGIGFEPGMSKLIFTIFQRLHPRNKYEGTGIGLALCKRIVLTHGGIIEASSEPGEGSVFTLLLPAKQPTA
ncbi:PAS domain-containing sensor histidine kinase [Paraflavitalea pollutisoli]|uniref:PAS domain-containing sensor histidine kinase n=1 Tax=Paraflavitalea pollutisoli TaxID=3034143 RepID=UPI0023EAB756|nr:PAS domain S-box protein [Paraflavitalea sp. H1-2-19X]